MARDKASHTIVGAVPELRYVLLRNNSTNKIEAWTQSRGVRPQSIVLDGQELEFVRDVRCAYRVPDNDFNRANAPHDIGRIYIDAAPVNALVQEIK